MKLRDIRRMRFCFGDKYKYYRIPLCHFCQFKQKCLLKIQGKYIDE